MKCSVLKGFMPVFRMVRAWEGRGWGGETWTGGYIGGDFDQVRGQGHLHTCLSSFPFLTAWVNGLRV